MIFSLLLSIETRRTTPRGGTDDEEFRYAAVVDRVNTIWTTWHATTFGCVRCHAHPYDPFTHEECYRFIAFFNNSEDCDQNDDFPRIKWSANEGQKLLEAQNRRKQLVAERNLKGWQISEAIEDWTAAIPREVRATAGAISIGANGVIETSGTLPVGVVSTLSMRDVEGVTAFRFHLLPESNDPLKWPEQGQVISELRVEAIRKKGAEPVASSTREDRPVNDSPANNSPVNDSTERVELAIRTVVADSLVGPFEPNESLEKGGPGFGPYPVMSGTRSCVFVWSEPIPSGTEGVEIHVTQSMASNSGFQGCPLRRFKIDVSRSNRWSEWANSEGLRALDSEIVSLRETIQSTKGELVPILQEREASANRTTRLHLRGNATTPAQSVEPGVPKVMRPSQGSVPRDRLELSRWMCSPENPLTSRTMANRLWAEMFGNGLVETLEDMGTSGSEPSHPELLDYLSYRLVHHHRWSLKSAIRELALTRTYGQTAKVDHPKRLSIDRNNRWLSRGPRTRLTAEMIRDQALVVSGLFADKMYGPPVFPPQPEGVWNTVYSGDAWKTSEGEDRYRRAIYTFQKRTSGYPGYLLFDAPSREFCTARRLPTNTPLQALATLNDPAFMELAHGFAKRMIGNGGTTHQQIREGLRSLTLEPPSESTVDQLVSLYVETKSELDKSPEEARSLGIDTNEAAMVLVANAILNLDAYLVR